MPLRISIVEDDPAVRKSLASIILGSPGFEYVGGYGSAEEALAEIPHHLPDVLLMDIGLPGRNGIECTAALKASHPKLQVLILTTYDESKSIFEALRAGASGYLLKRSRPEQLLKAIREVRVGGAPMSPSIARLVVSYFRRLDQPGNEVENLTQRELEVLQHLAKGLLYKEVAESLGIGIGTVRTHVEAIYRKLRVQTRTEAVLKLLSK